MPATNTQPYKTASVLLVIFTSYRLPVAWATARLWLRNRKTEQAQAPITYAVAVWEARYGTPFGISARYLRRHRSRLVESAAVYGELGRELPDGAPDVMHAMRDDFRNVQTALRSFNTRGGPSAPGDGA
ncbi:hypothetical protein [Streptomyces sp. NPDC002054]|uniref:hypothetical protein n=1 Tax=Streptomyces TaxID=1883 RepID=UPI00332111A5